MTRELPPFLRDLLASPPIAGSGVHTWLFKVARQLHAHLPAGEIVSLLESKVSTCGRHVSRKEIMDAVQSSLACAWEPTKGATVHKPQSKWPSVNEEQRAAIIRDNGGLADLWELSPFRIEDNHSHTEEIIDRLFPGNPLLCCGKSSSVFDTKPREEWRGELSKLQLIVPSPMSALSGLTKDGRESKHTLNNTDDRRFLICEFDKGATDDHAGILIHLAQYAPLVCAVHSAGKSLHGWFLVYGQPDDKVTKFFRYAVSIGADPATWTKSQFVRMPDGTRDNGKRQTVYFLNFKPMEQAR
ncbi:MAG: hypothetical protein ABIR24_10080 [Verrucomicrobiota bacterium]